MLTLTVKTSSKAIKGLAIALVVAGATALLWKFVGPIALGILPFLGLGKKSVREKVVKNVKKKLDNYSNDDHAVNVGKQLRRANRRKRDDARGKRTKD